MLNQIRYTRKERKLIDKIVKKAADKLPLKDREMEILKSISHGLNHDKTQLLVQLSLVKKQHKKAKKVLLEMQSELNLIDKTRVINTLIRFRLLNSSGGFITNEVDFAHNLGAMHKGAQTIRSSQTKKVKADHLQSKKDQNPPRFFHPDASLS